MLSTAKLFAIEGIGEMTNKAVDRAIAKYQAATSPAAIKAEMQSYKEFNGHLISAADLLQSHASELVREINRAAQL
jgi:hypothetical protein